MAPKLAAAAEADGRRELNADTVRRRSDRCKHRGAQTQCSAVFVLWRQRPMRGMVRGMKAEAPTIWELESDAEYLPPRSVAALVIGVLVALYAIALLLVARRAMGAFTAELPWQAVLITAFTSFAVISGLRILWRRAFPVRDRRRCLDRLGGVAHLGIAGRGRELSAWRFAGLGSVAAGVGGRSGVAAAAVRE